MKLNRTEAENLIQMLGSEDEQNGYIAMKAIDVHQYSEEDLGYLIYFFKFSKYSANDWLQMAPSAYGRLTKLINDVNAPLTYSKALTIMITNNVCRDSVELFLERHVKDLKDTLDRLGYPVEQLNFNITLKK